MMESIAIIAKPKHEPVRIIGEQIFDWLIERNFKVYLGEMTNSYIGRDPAGIIGKEIPEFIDLVVVLGGDGTILRVARSLKSFNTLILPINLGGLGFLTSFTQDQVIDSLKVIWEGNYTVSKRLMLKARMYRGDKLLHDSRVLNDVVINKAALARIIKLDTRVDDELITTYLCDGLIVATPTGSTAYSLSAGGPIIWPHLEAMTLTPICPHTLTNRPMVIGSQQTVEISLVSQDSEVTLTLDGQVGYEMNYLDKVVVTRDSHEIGIIQNPEKSFFDVLSHKLKWGQR